MPSCSFDVDAGVDQSTESVAEKAGAAGSGAGGGGGWRRGREHRGRFLGHQVIGLVLVLFVVAERLVVERSV